MTNEKLDNISQFLLKKVANITVQDAIGIINEISAIKNELKIAEEKAKPEEEEKDNNKKDK